MTIDVGYTFRALRHANFRRFFVGQGLSLIGTWLQQVAMGWVTWRLTGSAFLLGTIAFCSNVGILVLGPFAGVFADRVNRRRALLVTQTLLLAQAVTLAALVALGRLEVWHLVACALWLGIVSSFDIPLRQSLYVHLVDDRADLPNAIALNSFLVNSARVIGPALAGMLLAATSEAVCFALNALSFVAVIVAISGLRWPRKTVPERSGGFWSSWMQGARYAFGFAPVRALLALVAVAAWTITPYSSLMPIYAGQIFGGGAHTLGFLLAAAGVGALAATTYLASRSTIRGLGRRDRLRGGRERPRPRVVRVAHRVARLAGPARVRGRRRHPRRRVGEHDHPDGRRGPAARPRRRLLHDGVPRRSADRQPGGGCAREGDRRAGDIRAQRRAVCRRGILVLAPLAGARCAHAADLRPARDHYGERVRAVGLQPCVTGHRL